MPEMHLRQPGVTYSACGAFTKNIKRIQKFNETGYQVTATGFEPTNT